MKVPRPRTLGGWLIAVMLSALMASQALTMLMLVGERRIVAEATHRDETFRRVASAVQYLMARPAEGGVRSEAIIGSRTFRLGVAPRPQVGLESSNEAMARRLAGELRQFGVFEVRVTKNEPSLGIMGQDLDSPETAQKQQPFRDRWSRSDTVVGDTDGDLLWISVQLGPSRWLNVSAIPPPAQRFGLALVITTLLAGLAVTLAAAWAARRLTRPLQGLTEAAGSVGRGSQYRPAPEEGPEDLRNVAREFNAMASRVKMMIEEQQLLLRAVGHDLRTPLSSLRIRLEFVGDPELRQKMGQTLTEIEQLTARALEAARGGAVNEPTRLVDLGALVEAVCEDAAEVGKPVRLVASEEVELYCRSSELRRAIQNLIDNSVLHGGGATVSVSREGQEAAITVADQGPGIPEADLERVKEPFVRLDPSRTADVPGHGLGLTIAAAVAQRHSGTLMLGNRAEGGLEAVMRLPAPSSLAAE